MDAYSPTDVMTVTAARMLANGSVCFVGIGLPSVAANLARLTHAPDIVLIYESGTIGAKPSVLPLSIGDGELATSADTVVSTPEIFRYWLQGGRIETGFLGAAQIDRYGNINTTVIGPYRSPQVRLPGAGGAPEIAALADQVLVILKHDRRAFVGRLDFVTSAGQRTGSGEARHGTRPAGPAAVITDLGVLQPDPEAGELSLTRVHPGVSVDRIVNATGWRLKVSGNVEETEPPSPRELETLRGLLERTRQAHAGARC